MSQWMLFHLNQGIWKNDTLLTQASRLKMWTPHNHFAVDVTKAKIQPTHFHGYGLGWFLADYHGRLRVYHTGGYEGMLSAVSLLPEENLGIVVLTNSVKSPMSAVVQYIIDRYLNLPEKDIAATQLENYEKYRKQDTRIAHMKAARKLNTKPTLPLSSFTGTYYTNLYGNIDIKLHGKDQLKMYFERTSAYQATLKQWHYDVWEIVWDNNGQSFYSFGTVKFVTDNNLKVTGLEFEVPNDDIFFEELKPKKIK